MPLVGRRIDVEVREYMVHRHAHPDAGNLGSPEEIPMLSQISQEDFWSNDELLASISSSLPNYRLTKFQPLMPDWVEREILQNHLLDMQGVNVALERVSPLSRRSK